MPTIDIPLASFQAVQSRVSRAAKMDAAQFAISDATVDPITVEFTAPYEPEWTGALAAENVGAEVQTLESVIADLSKTTSRNQNNIGFLPASLQGFDLVTTFEAGNTWTTTGATGSFDNNNTTNTVIGEQCLTVTAATSGVKVARNLTLPTRDITGKSVGMLLKADTVATISDLSLYIGNNTTNFVRAQAIEGSQGASIFNDGEWTLVTLSLGEFDSVTGSPDLTDLTFAQLRVAATSGGDCTISCNGIFFFDPPEEARITISFDDGHASTATIAKIEMDKYMLPGVAYMVPQYVDDVNRLSQVQLDKMYEDGWEIGGHHISNDQRVDDEATIRATFQEIINWSNKNGYNVKSYAYPGGEWGRLVSDATTTVRDIAKDYFETARCIFQGSRETLPPADPHKLRVLYVTNAVTPATVLSEINKAATNKEWLHIVFHDIVESNADITTKYLRTDFVQVLSDVVASGIRVGTVEQFRNEMKSNAVSGGSGGASAWGGITGTLSDQTDLQAALDGKQVAGSYALDSHGHAISDVTGLQTELDGKQASGSYAAASHNHTASDVTDFSSAVDAAVAAYLTANPPVNSFYIWAEENGGIANNSYEWSYGNGATGNDIGVPIMVRAQLTHISINADTPGTSATLVARRQAGTTGTGTGSVVATTSALNGTTNRVYTLPTPIVFEVGDMLNVQTGTLVGTWTDVRACFRFEEI